MVYKDYYTPDLLIEPAEICDIMERAGTLDDTERGLDVANEYIRRNGNFLLLDKGNSECEWHWHWMLAVIYQAGRLQGIREQRAQRRERVNA